MKYLMYGSLLMAFACLLGYLLGTKYLHRKYKKPLAIGVVGFYLVFIVTAVYAYQNHRVAVKAIGVDTRDKIRVALSSSSKPATAVANGKISVKTRVHPTKIQPGQKIDMQFIVTNQSTVVIPDLRMRFAQGELATHFYIEDIKGNTKVYVLDNVITLGNLKPGEDKKVYFELMPKEDLDYTGRIFWQAGNNPILEADEKPLTSVIIIEFDEDYVADTDSADDGFEDFDSLQPVNEIIEEEKPPAEPKETEEPSEEEINEEINEEVNEEETIDNEEDNSVSNDVYDETPSI